MSLRRQQLVRKKELEEARKAGQAPAEVDEHGRDINPHIPKYIVSAPWYLDKGVPSLKHQKKLSDASGAVDGKASSLSSSASSSSSLKSNRHLSTGKIFRQATTYRKGACKNCGSMDHKTKNCLERPRRRGAHLTGEDIAADRITQDNNSQKNLSYEEKRDPWSRYTPKIYREKVVQKHDRLEQERKKLRETEIREKLLNNEDIDTNDHLKQRDGDETIFGMGADSRTRTNSKNLRIREDIPKYLRNLDTDTHYDAKTRSMRENPNPGVPLDELDYAGDNAYRNTGEYREWLAAQRFAWELSEKGERINTAALPSQVEKLHKQLKERKRRHREQQKTTLFKKYGGEEHFKRPKELAAANETAYYAEYSRNSGKVITSHKRVLQKSKYDEDIFEHGHTSVWGSLWKAGKWGYSCCGLFEKNAECPVTMQATVKEETSQKRKRGDTTEASEANGDATEEPSKKRVKPSSNVVVT